MANIQQKAVRIQKKLWNKLASPSNGVGTTVTVIREAYYDPNGVWVERTERPFKAFIDPVHKSEIPGVTDWAGFTSQGDDDHVLLMEYSADIKELDRVRFYDTEWQVSRWSPLSIGDFVVAYTVGVKRLGPQQSF